MKISSFNPLILSKDAEAAVKLFEDLGFETRHTPDADTGKSVVTTTSMKNADGFCVDVADVKSVERDFIIIRMNVDDFDAARAELEAKGFVPNNGGNVTVNASSKSMMLISPSGFAFDLCQHIK